MKRFLIAILLVVMCAVFGFAQTGTYTTNGYFYMPLYGAYGTTEFDEYNTYMQIADTQIEANKTASGDENIEDVAGAMWTGNTETFLTLTYQDGDGTVDAVVPVKDEDDMASDSATYLATQQSIKAYVDAAEAASQPLDAGLTSIADLTTAANDMIYTTALDTYAIMDTFAELQAVVADKTLVNEEDVFTIDANWVNTANPWADNEVANDITINLATLATTFTATDNENEDLACPVVFVDGATGAQGAETDGDYTYTPLTGFVKANNIFFGTFAESDAPDANDDVDGGFVVGSQWINTTADEMYVCLDNTDGAAVWSKAAPGGGGGSVDTSGTPVDNDFAKFTDADTIEGRSYLETRNDLENYTWYPQDYATGAGTDIDPWASTCIEDAYAAADAGDTIYLRAGYYQMGAALTLAKSINIIGEGIDRTFIVTADANGFYITADYVTLKDFTLDGDSQTTNEEGVYCIRADGDYTLIENVKVKNSAYYGISQVGDYSIFRNVYAVDNYRHGIHPGNCGYNTYDTIYCTGNGVNGLDVTGGAVSLNNIYNNIHSWSNTGMGIYIYDQIGGTLVNSVAHTNTSYGVEINGSSDFNMINCYVHDNVASGIYIANNGSNINLSNVVSKNNNTGEGGNGAALVLGTSTPVRLSNCQLYDDNETPLQAYAIFTTDGDSGDYLELIDCKLTPNLTGIINNASDHTIKGRDSHTLDRDHDWNGKYETALVGETVVFGELLYFNWTDKEWKKTDADAAATMPGLRIALESKVDGKICLMLVEGDIRDDSAFAFAGSIVYASLTPGDITSTAPSESGDQVQRVGVAAHADYFYFDPSPDVGEI